MAHRIHVVLRVSQYIISQYLIQTVIKVQLPPTKTPTLIKKNSIGNFTTEGEPDVLSHETMQDGTGHMVGPFPEHVIDRFTLEG